MRILIYGAGVIGGKSMKNEEYKKLSIAEFTKAAGRYESNHAGIYEMCKKDYPDILAELEKEESWLLVSSLSNMEAYFAQQEKALHEVRASLEHQVSEAQLDSAA